MSSNIYNIPAKGIMGKLLNKFDCNSHVLCEVTHIASSYLFDLLFASSIIVGTLLILNTVRLLFH
jgi:hypothetical protein